MAQAHVSRMGWSDMEAALLWEEVGKASQDGKPLRSVFDQVAIKTGRKPNSIRNFYYAQMQKENKREGRKSHSFQQFQESEVRELIKNVLRDKGEGLSVRASVQRLADGDKTLMLRYQNKYRSVLKTRPQLVREVLVELQDEGAPTADPYVRQVKIPMGDPVALHTQVYQNAQQLGESAVTQMLTGMDVLIKLAMAHAPVRDKTLELDRMNARYEMAVIELDDAQKTIQDITQQVSAVRSAAREDKEKLAVAACDEIMKMLGNE